MNNKQRMEWAIFLLLMQGWFFVLWTHGADWAWGVLGISGAVSLIGLIMLEGKTVVSEPAVDPMHFEFDRPEPIHWNLPDLPRWNDTRAMDHVIASLEKAADKLDPAGKKPRMQQVDGIKYRPRLQPEPLYVCPQNSFLHPHDQHGRHLFGYEEEIKKLDLPRLKGELVHKYHANLTPDAQFPCNDISIFTYIEPGSLFVCPENSLPHPHDENGRHIS
jgi:hypothetical protein